MSAPVVPKNPLTGDPNQHDVSKFSSSITGMCLCGSIVVTINDNIFANPQRGHLCHCANCRKIAGSYVSSNMMIEKEKVTFEDHNGTLKKYEDYATASGNCVARFFCGACGCPIRSEPAIFPNVYILKMGMFPRIPKPEWESFALHKQEWQGMHEGLQQFETLKGGKKVDSS